MQPNHLWLCVAVCGCVCVCARVCVIRAHGSQTGVPLRHKTLDLQNAARAAAGLPALDDVEIGDLGSGSDFTPFFQVWQFCIVMCDRSSVFSISGSPRRTCPSQAPMACITPFTVLWPRFIAAADGTPTDSFDWMSKFGDPTFEVRCTHTHTQPVHSLCLCAVRCSDDEDLGSAGHEACRVSHNVYARTLPR